MSLIKLGLSYDSVLYHIVVKISNNKGLIGVLFIIVLIWVIVWWIN